MRRFAPAYEPDLSGARKFDTPDNTKLHVYFHHTGIFCGGIGDNKECLISVLNKVWANFGRVTNYFYHKEFSFGFVTFSTHAEAKAALDSMKDVSQFRGLLAGVRETLDDQSKDRLDRLFVTDRGSGELASPSWANPNHGQEDRRLIIANITSRNIVLYLSLQS
jgi:hypothetical protein